MMDCADLRIQPDAAVKIVTVSYTRRVAYNLYEIESSLHPIYELVRTQSGNCNLTGIKQVSDDQIGNDTSCNLDVTIRQRKGVLMIKKYSFS